MPIITVYGYLSDSQMLTPEQMSENGIEEQVPVPSGRATELGVAGRGIFTIDTEAPALPVVTVTIAMSALVSADAAIADDALTGGELRSAFTELRLAIPA